VLSMLSVRKERTERVRTTVNDRIPIEEMPGEVQAVPS
jgi:hypothetical protein